MAKTRNKPVVSGRRKPARAAGKQTAAATQTPAAKQNKVSWLAAGYPVMSPVTVLDDCAGAIEWYKKVLGAKQRLRMDMPGGRVAHCELGFGDSVLMLGSSMPPQFPPMKASLGVYVKDCDATYQKALSAGARSVQEPTDQFYGDRNAVRGPVRQRMVGDNPHQGRLREGDEAADGPDGRRLSHDETATLDDAAAVATVKGAPDELPVKLPSPE